MIGLLTTVIESNGSTSLTEVGNQFYLYSGGVGPALTYGGAAVVAGQYGAWAPIAAEQTASGYEVAWKLAGADQYTVWSTDSSGNYLTNVIGIVSGTNSTLQSLEPSFYQDLNSDGFIGSPSTVIEASGNVIVSVPSFAQSATIDSGATLELTGADANSVTFKGATGTLSLDHSSTFSGQVVGLTGNGIVANSDVIDLKDVVFAYATVPSYSGSTAGGTLTVGDTKGHVAHVSLVGDYTNSTFTLFSDGNGGTLVVDPPVTPVLAGISPVSGAGAKGGASVGKLLPNDGSGVVSRPTLGAANTPNGHDSTGANFSADPNPVTRNIAQSYDTAIADTGANRASGAIAPSGLAMNGRPANRSNDSVAQANLPVTALGVSSFAVTPSEQRVSPAASRNAIAREVVSPNDVISAINGGNIAIKFGGTTGNGAAPERQVWLFDDAKGTFVPPAPEPLTIVIHDEASASLAKPVEEAMGLMATAAMISTESTWLGALRQFRRKAAWAMRQGARWTE
jgi:hypothetical protein